MPALVSPLTTPWVTPLASPLGLITAASDAALADRYAAQGHAASFLASDLSGSNGASVTSWAAHLGGFTANGGTSPTLRTSGNSNFTDTRQAVRFTSASSQYLRCDALGSLASSGAAFAAAALLRRNGTGDYNVVGFGNSSGTVITQVYLVNFTFAGLGSPNLYDTGPHPSSGSPPPTRTTEDALVIWQRNPGGTSSVWVNGQHISFALPANSDTYGRVAIGAVPFNGSFVNFANIDLARFDLWNRILGDHDIAALTYQMGCVDMGRWQAVALGDSITAGTATLGHSWFNALSTDAWIGSHAYSLYDVAVNSGNVYECTTAGTSAGSGGPTGTGSNITDGTAVWRWVNYALPSTCLGLAAGGYTPSTGINRGVAGRTLMDVSGSGQSNEYDNLAADITSLYDAYIPRLVVVFFRNEKTFGVSDAETMARAETVCNAIRAANPRDYLVIATPLKGTDVDTTGVANLIRLHGLEFADAIWDAAACPELQTPADTAWFGDGIHPTKRGQTALCAAFPIRTYQHAALVKQNHLMLRS
jgi:hypothetical protein